MLMKFSAVILTFFYRNAQVHCVLFFNGIAPDWGSPPKQTFWEMLQQYF